MISTLVVMYFVAAACCAAFGRRLGGWVVAIGGAVSGVAFAWLAGNISSIGSGDVVRQQLAWVPQLGLGFDFVLDGFSLLAGLVVSGIGVLVFVYSWWYFASHDHDQPGHRPDLWKLTAYLTAFAGSMMGLVLADGFLTLFVFWELTSITSFLLIGIDDTRLAARASARQALLVTGGGGLALLAGLVLIEQSTGVSSWTELAAVGLDPSTVSTAGLVLVLAGVFTKSAQFPFHFWLPGAMAAPTPISAYLHSATMVKAGVILCARLAPAAAEVSWWRPTLVVVGGATMLVGGVGALRQFDAKLILAHGTVSQLGLLMLLVGLGTSGTTYAGVALFSAHALFKAALFLGVGIIDHQCHTRDIRKLSALHRSLPAVIAAMGVAAASMAALPPTFGFVAKEKALDALLHAGVGWSGSLALVVVVSGSVLTVAYTARLMWGLVGDWSPEADRGAGHADVHSPAIGFIAPSVLLAALSVVFGLVAGPVGSWIAKAASPLDTGAGAKKLVLWPGVNLALGLSLASIVGGISLAAILARSLRAAPSTPDAPVARGERAFGRAFDRLLVTARQITSVTQSGSLPAYVATVLVVLGAVLIAAIVRDNGESFRPASGASVPFAHSWTEVVLAVVTGGLALAVPLARRRLEAAVLLGAVGLGVAMLFLIWGALDLALTQILIEMLSVVMFVLVLRHLPRRFGSAPSWAPTRVRLGLAAIVGGVVATFGYLASNARTARSAGEQMMQESLPLGGGRNVVNVILVDIRGFDTLGEITVVAVAAVGVVNLVATARREQRRKRFGDTVEVDQ